MSHQENDKHNKPITDPSSVPKNPQTNNSNPQANRSNSQASRLNPQAIRPNLQTNRPNSEVNRPPPPPSRVRHQSTSSSKGTPRNNENIPGPNIWSSGRRRYYPNISISFVHNRSTPGPSASTLSSAYKQHYTVPRSFSATPSRNTPVPSTSSDYNQYYNFSVSSPDWTPLPVPPMKPVVAMPMPVVASYPPRMSTPYDYPPPGFMQPLIPAVLVGNHETYPNQESFYNEPQGNVQSNNVNTEAEDPLSYYMALPKNLFPPDRRMPIDPNVMIDALCQLENIIDHMHWILDLELGITRAKPQRILPYYNLKLNNILCIGAETVVHPEFDSCNENFKQLLLAYYEAMMSMWYRSYSQLYNDCSLDNFQAWLAHPMQRVGMCWLHN